MNILILSGTNHGFEASATVIYDFLSQQVDLSVTLTDDRNALMDLANYNACVFGIGFTRRAQQEDGKKAWLPNYVLKSLVFHSTPPSLPISDVTTSFFRARKKVTGIGTFS